MMKTITPTSEAQAASSLLQSSWQALGILFFLSFLYFLESFDRYLIAVSPIPYIDYASYEYSILAGPAFTVVYTLGGLLFALHYAQKHIREQRQERRHQRFLQRVRWLLPFPPQEQQRQQHSAGSSRSKFTVLAFATFIFSFAFGATAAAFTFWQQVIVRIVMGLTQSLITPFSTAIISDYFPPTVRGGAFGLFNSATYFAFSLSLSLGTFLYVTYGWRTGYLLFSIVGMTCALFIPLLRFLRSRQEHEEEQIGEDQRHVASAVNNNFDQPMNPSNPIIHIASHTDTTKIIENGGEYASEENCERDRSFVSMSSISNPSDGFRQESAETSFGIDDDGDGVAAFWGRILRVLYRIAVLHWWNHPGVYTLCLATAIRIGGGYLWASYTSVFFSDLLAPDAGNDCKYSHHSVSDDYSGGGSGGSSGGGGNDECNDDFPYCVDGICSMLTDYPWHNEGLASVKLETYMSWVPIIGSALGSLLGGLLSDFVIQRQKQAAKDNGSADKRKNTDEWCGNKSPTEYSSSDGNGKPRLSMQTLEQYPTEIDNKSLHYPEADSLHCMSADSSRIPSSSIPVDIRQSLLADHSLHGVAPTNAAAVTTQVVDHTAGDAPVAQKNERIDQSSRLLIAAVSNVLSLPLVIGALFLEYPYCFIIFIPSGMLGELYLGQALALLTDEHIIPADLLTPSIALFMFLITIIGGNIPLLVPYTLSVVGFNADVDLTFRAAEAYNKDISGTNNKEYKVEHTDARQLQYSLVYLLSFCYLVSSILYFVAFLQMRRHYLYQPQPTKD